MADDRKPGSKEERLTTPHREVDTGGKSSGVTAAGSPVTIDQWSTWGVWWNVEFWNKSVDRALMYEDVAAAGRCEEARAAAEEAVHQAYSTEQASERAAAEELRDTLAVTVVEETVAYASDVPG